MARTAPYMHDGRFATLREVIEHYNSGVQASADLDSFLRNPDGTAKRLNLAESDKAALEAFLNALTDPAFLADPKFSDPFTPQGWRGTIEAVQDANARLREFLEASLTEGPQVVTRRGVEAAVLVSIHEWRALRERALPDLKSLLLTDPRGRGDLRIPARGRWRRRPAAAG